MRGLTDFSWAWDWNSFYISYLKIEPWVEHVDTQIEEVGIRVRKKAVTMLLGKERML